jgi:hypothetical protein
MMFFDARGYRPSINIQRFSCKACPRGKENIPERDGLEASSSVLTTSFDSDNPGNGYQNGFQLGGHVF